MWRLGDAKYLFECRLIGSKVTRSRGGVQFPVANGHIVALQAQAGGSASMNGRTEVQTAVAGSPQKWPDQSAAESIQHNGETPAAISAKNGQLNMQINIDKEHQATASRDPQMVNYLNYP